jgi:hypothetical protein
MSLNPINYYNPIITPDQNPESVPAGYKYKLQILNLGVDAPRNNNINLTSVYVKRVIKQ